MAGPYSLFGDTSGLPHTTRSAIAYEIDALSPREVWGAGNGSTTLTCRVKFGDALAWIRDVVGEVGVTYSGGVPVLKRYVPEGLGYGSADWRVQFCTMIDQIDQGGTPDATASPSGLFQGDAGTGWPITQWCRYRATWEAVPYAVLGDTAVAAVASYAGSSAGAAELYRYVVRTRKAYGREQPIPAAGAAGGFRVADDTSAGPGKAVGQVGFRVVSLADVTYKWVRVPLNWPPPIGWATTDQAIARAPSGGALIPWPILTSATDDTTPPVNAGVNLTVGGAAASLSFARDSFIGSINSTTFDAAAADGYAWAPGTLLYLGYDDSNRYYDAAGQWVCDVVYRFKYKEGGWNTFLNALGKWVEVTDNGRSPGYTGGTVGNPPYASNDFNKLFQYAAS
jgi:hypothetical protein